MTFKIGDKVSHKYRKPLDTGTVIENNDYNITVEWESGHKSKIYSKNLNKMLSIESIRKLTKLEIALK